MIFLLKKKEISDFFWSKREKLMIFLFRREKLVTFWEKYPIFSDF